MRGDYNTGQDVDVTKIKAHLCGGCALPIIYQTNFFICVKRLDLVAEIIDRFSGAKESRIKSADVWDQRI